MQVMFLAAKPIHYLVQNSHYVTEFFAFYWCHSCFRIHGLHFQPRFVLLAQSVVARRDPTAAAVPVKVVLA
jgi:hypothetical protein